MFNSTSLTENDNEAVDLLLNCLVMVYCTGIFVCAIMAIVVVDGITRGKVVEKKNTKRVHFMLEVDTIVFGEHGVVFDKCRL
eukprot:CAMPEP_0203756060 /NCGR_PEP_ID=MMETSP0098-20131031/9395_1 /ASSEMBLY_ACC=CAM_ASM_000208 /TAXON_ID=96639 /ORGANISM=" , Strain NY0313808BC1" /LENGTH=81 /DNA_ID=CAMNT_0050647767 /DNA_START=22 /DNA_END=267 /DNA_ORIENTATION=-